jgi:hypothetical protein
MIDRRCFFFQTTGGFIVLPAESRQRQVAIMREDAARRARWAERKRPWWRRLLGPYA